MKLAIVGSRNYADLDAVRRYVRALPLGTVVVSGGADGVDQVAIEAARKAGLPTVIVPPQWRAARSWERSHAGMKRNKAIVAFADEVVAFWDGISRGTKDTIEEARRVGKLREVFSPQVPEEEKGRDHDEDDRGR